jgi:hypothetical protein
MFGAYSAGRYANIRRVLICQRVMAERLGLIAMSEEPEDTWIRDSVEQLIHKFREAKAKLFVPPKEKHWSDPLWDRVEMQWAIRDTRKAIEAKERRRQYDRARRARGRAQVMAARPTESTHLDTKRVTTAHKCIFKE